MLLKHTKIFLYERREIVLIAFIAAALYSRTLAYGFAWDDIIHIYENPLLQGPFLENLKKIWEGPYQGLYIPLCYTVWAFTASIFGALNPAPFHALNVAAHALNSVLVFFLLSKLFSGRNSALAGALIFAVHPVQAETVAWISQFSNLGSFAFCAASILCFLRFTETENRRAFASALLFFACALLTKPSAAALPLIIIIITGMYGKNLKKIPYALSFFLLSIPAAIITKFNQSDEIISTLVPFFKRPFVAADASNFYIYKIILPLNLGPSYGRTPDLVADGQWFYASPLPLIAAAFLIWKFRKRIPYLPASFLVFLAAIAPVSGIIPFAFQEWSTTADKYLYLPMTAAAMIAAGAFAHSGKILKAAYAALILLLFLLTLIGQIPVWKNDSSLWNHAHKINPGCPHVLFNSGKMAEEKGDMQSALALYTKAADIKPDFILPFINRAAIFASIGDYDAAMRDTEHALRVNPVYKQSIINKAAILLKQYRPLEAIEVFSYYLGLYPDETGVYAMRAQTYYAIDEIEKACDDIEKIKKLGGAVNPDLEREINCMKNSRGGF